MERQRRQGLLHFIDGLYDALKGLRAGWTHAVAFRQEVIIFVAGTVLAAIFGETPIERAILIGVMFPVLVAELVNTAIETTVDRIGLDHNELSGRAKDLAAAAVFISIIGAATVWGLVLFG